MGLPSCCAILVQYAMEPGWFGLNLSAAHCAPLFPEHHCGLLYASGPMMSALSGTYPAPSPASQFGLKMYLMRAGRCFFAIETMRLNDALKSFAGGWGQNSTSTRTA